MISYILITWTSLKIALKELWVYKLRTFLSLLGISFGIFSIISVLATISSMKQAITKELNAIGGQVIFVQKFEASADAHYPWWKYINRPEVKSYEMDILKAKMPQVSELAFLTSITSSIETTGNLMSGINYYGISEDFDKIQSFSIGFGRNFLLTEFSQGSNTIIVGYQIAEELFGTAEYALHKKVKLKGQKLATIVGVINKQGKSILDAWDYDNSILLPHNFMKQMARDDYSNPVIMVKASGGMTVQGLRDELTGSMRSIRKLKPGQENNFALNDIGFFSKFLEPIFTGLSIGGWAIAALSLFVGMFGVANIMFVSVKERTSQIGLKKAIGAKKINIISEFLLESILLCLIGGIIGLSCVFILTQLLTAALSFKVFIPFDIIVLAVCLCIGIGVLSGLLPAIKASNLDPVTAIRATI